VLPERLAHLLDRLLAEVRDRGQLLLVFITRSPIVSIPTRLRQLYERTPSSSSSIGKFSIPCASAASGVTPPSTGAASPKPSMRSRSVKIASCRIRISAASASESFGSTEPSVVMSSVSLS
jgi:hypothetical protein